MNRKEMPYDEFVELLAIRLREMRDAPPEEQERLGRMAWRMTLRDVPWRVVLAAIRTEFGASREPRRHPIPSNRAAINPIGSPRSILPSDRLSWIHETYRRGRHRRCVTKSAVMSENGSRQTRGRRSEWRAMPDDGTKFER